MPPPAAASRVPRLSRLGSRLVIFFVVLLLLVNGVGAFLVLETNSQIARQTLIPIFSPSCHV